MTAISEPGVYDGMSDAEYHADPVVGGSLSSTGARTILDSPARYAWEQQHRVEKDAYDVGHYVHAKVLGVGMGVEVLDFDSRRSNAYKAAEKTARANGLVPVLAKDVVELDAMAEAILDHPLAKALLELPGKPEQSLFAPDPITGVWLRARIDHLPDRTGGRTICTDVKTARSANPVHFRKAAAEYGYDVQAEFYQHVLRLARGDADTAFVFVVVEKDPPHLVSVVELVGEFAETGRRRVRRAVDLYKRCRDADEWPGYAPVVHPVDPPRWYVAAVEEEEMSA